MTLRAGTALPPFELAFVLNIGGIGDYIHWTTAIQYAIETNEHISGRIYVRPFFQELAEHWFLPYAERFELRTYEKIAELKDKEKTVRMRSPYDCVTAVYHHSLMVGFYTYAMTDAPPEEWQRLPRITGQERDVSHFNLPQDYVVITTEATSAVRKLPPETINRLTAGVLARGLTPVFLGRAEVSPQHKTLTNEGVSTEGVIDLREKTGLLEAAVILSGARAVMGLDNGLLHLASCSEVPVIFAFTTADPRHRLVPRAGKTKVIVPPKELSCRFCQSNVKFLHHDFRNCLYQDALCCSTLRPEDFLTQLDEVLK